MIWSGEFQIALLCSTMLAFGCENQARGAKDRFKPVSTAGIARNAFNAVHLLRRKEISIESAIVLILAVPIVVAIWLIVHAISTGTNIRELTRRLNDLEREVEHLKREGGELTVVERVQKGMTAKKS